MNLVIICVWVVTLTCLKLKSGVSVRVEYGLMAIGQLRFVTLSAEHSGAWLRPAAVAEFSACGHDHFSHLTVFLVNICSLHFI